MPGQFLTVSQQPKWNVRCNAKNKICNCVCVWVREFVGAAVQVGDFAVTHCALCVWLMRESGVREHSSQLSLSLSHAYMLLTPQDNWLSLSIPTVLHSTVYMDKNVVGSLVQKVDGNLRSKRLNSASHVNFISYYVLTQCTHAFLFLWRYFLQFALFYTVVKKSWLCNVMQEKQATTKTHRCGWYMLLISQNFNTQRFNLHLLQIFFGGLASSTSRAARKTETSWQWLM